MKRIIITDHAAERMQEREFTRSEVEGVIETPDWKMPARRGKIKAKKRFGDRVLSIVYRETRTVVIVITGYWRGR